MLQSNNEYIEYLVKEIKIVDVFDKLGFKINNKASSTPVVLCPFHPDKNPSLVLYEKQYHCFSCDAHGNIFTIIMKYTKCTFNESIIWIEKEFPHIQKFSNKLNKPYNHINENGYDIAFECYNKMTITEKKSLTNFASDRGYDINFLINAGVFYAKSRKVINEFKKQQEILHILFKHDLLKEKTKIINGDDKNYFEDTFISDRVILTLKDYDEKIVGFAGRAVQENVLPKYLYTKNFKKGEMLYRLNEVKKECIIENQSKHLDLYITEGPFDALRLKTFGFNAISCLGSSITAGQVKVLAKFLTEFGSKFNSIRLHLFLDSDGAGLKGTYRSVRNLWLNDITRMIFIDVTVNKDELTKEHDNGLYLKDPDGIFKNSDNGNVNDWFNKNCINVFTFLMRYFCDEILLAYNYPSFEEYLENSLPINQKIALFNKMNGFVSDTYWKEIISFYSIIMGSNDSNKIKESTSYEFNIFKKYFRPTNEMNESSGEQKLNTLVPTTIMNHALQIAKNSYLKEEVPIDEFTWERIQLCGDAFFPYFIDLLKNSKNIELPMIAINLPKKKSEYRLKALYSHEQLIMQQYVLNELLRADNNRYYENIIPAIRYNPNSLQSSFTTGLGYYDFFNENEVKNVSFAYQINSSDE